MDRDDEGRSDSTIEPDPLASIPPQPLRPMPLAEPRWQFWRRARVRDYSEQYRPPHWWQRVFSLLSLGVIALTVGVMVAVGMAAAVAAAAIALQSLVS